MQHDPSGHEHHDAYAGHDAEPGTTPSRHGVAMFRDRFGLSLILTIPIRSMYTMAVRP